MEGVDATKALAAALMPITNFYESSAFRALCRKAFDVSGHPPPKPPSLGPCPRPGGLRPRNSRNLPPRRAQMCDVDQSNKIDVKELHIGTLLMYHQINKRLPLCLTPPTHDEVRKLFHKHDDLGNSNGKMDFDVSPPPAPPPPPPPSPPPNPAGKKR